MSIWHCEHLGVHGPRGHCPMAKRVEVGVPVEMPRPVQLPPITIGLVDAVSAPERESGEGGFVAFIGNGDNSRGQFPKNLTELNADWTEFAAARAPGRAVPVATEPIRWLIGGTNPEYQEHVIAEAKVARMFELEPTIYTVTPLYAAPPAVVQDTSTGEVLGTPAGNDIAALRIFAEASLLPAVQNRRALILRVCDMARDMAAHPAVVQDGAEDGQPRDHSGCADGGMPRALPVVRDTDLNWIRAEMKVMKRTVAGVDAAYHILAVLEAVHARQGGSK